MADYKITRPRKEAQLLVGIMDIQAEGIKNREESAKKIKRNEDFYNMGHLWYINGKRLKNARDLVNFNGQKMTDEDFKSFKNGFMSMLRGRAYSYGQKGVNLNDLPEECLVDSNFMDDYIEGIGFKFGYDGKEFVDLPEEFLSNNHLLMGFKRGILKKENESKVSKKRR